MPDDILEIKPGLYGFRLNIRALIRRFTRQAKKDPVAVVAQRFLQLFQDHGVPIAQIPRLVPQVTLDKLMLGVKLEVGFIRPYLPGPCRCAHSRCTVFNGL
jgi:hypothetical protein